MWPFKRSAVGSRVPDITGVDWFNGEALGLPLTENITAKELTGKVGVIEFWDYECRHCIDTIPHMQRWWEKFKERDFYMIGVHTPEFAYARDREKVQDAVIRFKISYPVVSDPNYENWDRFKTKAWPRLLAVGKDGVILHDQTGTGGFKKIESALANAF